MSNNEMNLDLNNKMEEVEKIVKSIFTKEKLDETHNDLCRDITYFFLFSRKFNKIATGNEEIPYKLESKGETFTLEDYKTVKDFETMFNGNLEYSEEDKTFETFGKFLFEGTKEEIDELITIEFEKKFGDNSYIEFIDKISEDDTLLRKLEQIYNQIAIEIWTRFVTEEMEPVINKYKEEIIKEEMDSAKLRDVILEEKATQSFLYQEIVEELAKDYDLDLMEILEINAKDKESISILNDWASSTHYKNIVLLNQNMVFSGFPTNKSYAWLDEKTYEQKKKEFEQSVKEIDTLFENLGLKVSDKLTSYMTDKIYMLLDEIFKIPGEKFVSIFGNEICKTYAFDEYNRIITDVFEDNETVLFTYDSLINDLDYQLNNNGTLLVKNLIGKNLVKEDKEVIEVTYYELRSALLRKGVYAGLKKNDTEKFFKVIKRHAKEVQCVDWNIGAKNIEIIMIDNSNNNGENIEEDE